MGSNDSLLRKSSQSKFSFARLLRVRPATRSLVELSESPEPLVLSVEETRRAHNIDTKAQSSKQQTASTRQ